MLRNRVKHYAEASMPSVFEQMVFAAAVGCLACGVLLGVIYALLRSVLGSADLRTQLTPGGIRTLGNADAVVRRVVKHPDLFGELFDCVDAPDAGLRMRAVHVIDMVAESIPNTWQHTKSRCLGCSKKRTASPTMADAVVGPTAGPR
ncbi:MAG: hypothetical protein R3C68_13065 [Myxococcota bacterium]